MYTISGTVQWKIDLGGENQSPNFCLLKQDFCYFKQFLKQKKIENWSSEFLDCPWNRGFKFSAILVCVECRNHFRTGGNSPTANQKLLLEWFLKLTLHKRWITPSIRAWNALKQNGVRSCVHFCLRALLPFERCGSVMWHLMVSCSFGSDAGVDVSRGPLCPDSPSLCLWDEFGILKEKGGKWQKVGFCDHSWLPGAGLQRWRHVLHRVRRRRRPCNWQWRKNRKTGKHSHATIIFKNHHHPQLFNLRWMPNSSQKVLAVSWEQAHQDYSNDTPQKCEGFKGRCPLLHIWINQDKSY